MKILIYGSTYLTEVACKHLLQYPDLDLVGHIPSRAPTVKGFVPLLQVDESVQHDIKLSLGYDMRIKNYDNAYNIHPGILPEYGGCDILYHTIKNSEKEQGLTFHKMVYGFDAGPIISKITYPVFPSDTILDLYHRVAEIYPSFVLSSVKLLKNIGKDLANSCQCRTPTLYRRGDIHEDDKELYETTFQRLKEFEQWNSKKP